jgi:hypothetical protein
LGKIDGFDFGNLKDFFADKANISAQDVTWTDVKNTFSLVEVRLEVLDKVTEALNGTKHNGRPVKVESRGNRDAGIPRTRTRGGGGGGERSRGDFSPRRDSGSSSRPKFADKDKGKRKKKW